MVDTGSNRITLMELTVLWDTETSIKAAEERKKLRYADLTRELNSVIKTELITVEVGARGLITPANKAKITHLCNLGKVRKVSAVLQTVSKLALIGSRCIWNGRNATVWGSADPQ